MERPIIPKATLKNILEFKPTIEGWFNEADSSLLMDRIKPWSLTEEIINEFIEAEINYNDYFRRNKENYEINLCGFALFYMKICLIIIDEYYSFERLKRIFERFLTIQKDCFKLDSRSRTELLGADTEDSDFLAFEKFTKIINEKCSKEEIKIIEDMIENNLDIFLEFECFLYHSKNQRSDKYLDRFIQEDFPFSCEFIQKNYEYFLIDYILKNPVVSNNIDMQKFVFKKVLTSNLKKHLAYYSRNTETRDFVIDDDMVDGLVLKYNLK